MSLPLQSESPGSSSVEPSDLPEDPRLAEIARVVARTRSGAALCDPNWNLVWVSDELKQLLDEHDKERLGYGKHLVQVYTSEAWGSKVTEESQLRFFLEEFPLLIQDTPGGKRGLADALKSASDYWEDPPAWAGGEKPTDESIDQLIDAIRPVKPPPIWTTHFDFLQGDLPPLRVVELHVRLYGDDGEFLGTLIAYEPGLSASVMTLVARGDEAMFERMARLFEPGRRQAAVLFADLQESSVLSRRLPSAAYFKLIKEITTAVDQVVADCAGIVGKHAGDGVTAFFLADELGSSSAAGKVAIEAARDIVVAVRDATKTVSEETGLVDPDDCLFNVGVHWGGTLYIGQLVTGGRLEVTALGDEVNEAARIQESARDGKILVSKVLVEHLTEDDAAALGIDPDRVLYRTISELPGATKKAVRDAGGVPVTVL